jgi:WD40 repeat protein
MPHWKVAPAVAAAIVLLGTSVWIFLVASKARPEERKITTLALSSTGRWLASGTSAGRICIWDLGRSQLVQEIREDHDTLNELRFSPDERQLAIANGNLTLVPIGRTRTVEVIRNDQANYGTAQFTADGGAVLVITSRGSIEIIEIATRQTRLKVCCSTIYGEVAFSPDDALIFNAGHNPGIWDARSGSLLARLTTAREFATFGPIAFDVPRNLAYMGSQDGRVYAWDVNTRQLRTTSPAQHGYVNTISVVGKTGWIAYAAFAGVVQLWNPESREHRETLTARTTSNLVFDASSNLMLLGTEKGVIESWDLVQGKIRRSLALP